MIFGQVNMYVCLVKLIFALLKRAFIIGGNWIRVSKWVLKPMNLKKKELNTIYSLLCAQIDIIKLIE